LTSSSWVEPCEYGNDPVEQSPGFGVLFRGEDSVDIQDILHNGTLERRTSGDFEGSSSVTGSRLAVAFRDVLGTATMHGETGLWRSDAPSDVRTSGRPSQRTQWLHC